MKKLLAIVLTMCLLAGAVPTFAYDGATAQSSAEFLAALDLFRGTDNGFELEKPLTRLEALIMLIRLSGKEMDALYPQEELSHPFTDAPDWEGAENYIAYGYANKITAGMSETEFGPNVTASKQMYVTFILRALGYTDEQGSVWENWETLGTQAGILTDATASDTFLRGDAAILSRAALGAKLYGSEQTLKDYLTEQYVIHPLSLSIAEAKGGKVITPDSPLSDILGKVYSNVEDLYPQGLMTMEFAAKDGKYYIMGEETDKENYTDFLASFIGADAEKIGVTEALVCEPMMTSRAHSVAVLRIKDGADAEAAKKEIRENVNPRKWVCVGVNPKNVKVENIGNLILLAMDDASGDAMSAAFRSMDTSLVVPGENGYMEIDGMLMEAEAPFNMSSAQKFAEKFNELKSEHFAENKTYIATIPEKSFYAKDKTVHYLNHNSVEAFISDAFYDWTYVDIASALSLGDYYKTDRHWKQENLHGVMDAFGAAMGFAHNKDAYTATTVENYIGDYAKDIANLTPETLTYLTSDAISGAAVSDFQNKNVTTVYNTEKLNSKIPYDVFLSGATPLTVITNPNASEKRELVIFRDSYGSSVAPLFVEHYSKITLVDLRYMASSLLKQFVTFDGAEVLVLLSDKVVNNSNILK